MGVYFIAFFFKFIYFNLYSSEQKGGGDRFSVKL